MIRLLREALAPYRGRLAGLLVLQLGATVAMLYLPSLNGRIVDDGIAQGDIGEIWRLGTIMLVISFAQIGASVGATYLAASVAARTGRDLRGRVFDRVAAFSTQQVDGFGAGTLISRSTNDVTQVQMLVYAGLAMMVTAPIMMVGGVFMAMREDIGLSWLVAVAIPLLGVTVGLTVWRMLPHFHAMQESVDAVNRVLREQITGLRVVRAFVREDGERARFAEVNAAYTGAALAVGKLMAIVFPVVMFVFNASTVAVLWFGAFRVENGQMDVGQLTAFMAYLLQVLMSVMMATFMTLMIPRASVSAGRIREVLDAAPTLLPPAVPEPIPAGSIGVELRGVDFHYPGAEHPVLCGVDLVAEPGTTTAVIGSTGAGKTTLLSLVPRLYDATGGAVLLGGTDVRDASLEDVWDRIGLVPQRPYLFTGTVASNLRLGDPDADDEQLWEALRIAQAADFVRAMDGGLDAEIAQGGTNVSGGQRQRLAIARALVKAPGVYLFDDAFSALDLATDAALRAALRPVTADAAVVVVAQRVSSILDADRIVVLDDGLVVGTGTHEELLDSCPTYEEIVRSQLIEQAAT